MRTNSYWKILALSVVGGFVTAIAFVAATSFMAPAGDVSHQQSLLATLSDPFVILLALPAAVICGLFVSPVAYYFLRTRRLRVAFPIVLGSTVVAVAATTPFGALIAIPVAALTVAVSCALCARVQITQLSER